MTEQASPENPKNARRRGFDEPYAPLSIDPALATRTVTALRPYRPSGFVLRREEAGEKTVIHNYGHGGCGVTLGGGCAELAADLAGDLAGRDVAVIGAGVIGLTAAHELAARGAKVTVYADQFTPDTTSDVAGALWFPVTLYEDGRASEVFLAQFREAARRAFARFTQLLDQPRYGVYWMRFHELSEDAEEVWPDRVEGNDLYPEWKVVSGNDAFGFPNALRYHALMIDPSCFMPALMEDIRAAGGQFETRRFSSWGEVLALPETLIVNCTGLGAGALLGDEEMTPVRGQLTLLQGQPEIDYGYALGRGQSAYFYMFPRTNEIVLGGTKDVGNDDLAISDVDRERILSGHAEIAAHMNEGGAK